MKLRLPLMLLSAVLAVYPVVHGATVDLKPSGNSPDAACGLTTSLSMTNTSMETIASLLIHDLNGETTLTLGSGGLTVTGELIFDGAAAGMGMHINGSSLSTGGLSVTGRGTLSVGADLKMGEGLKTTVSGSRKSVVNLSNVVLEGGEIVFASEGATNVKKVTVGTQGGTLTWEGENTLDFSKILNFTSGNATLTLNAGAAGLVLDSVVGGTGSTLNLASGNMTVVQGQTQNFKVDDGAVLTFNATVSVSVAMGNFSGNGTVVLLNTGDGGLSLTDSNKFGQDWSAFGGRFVFDGGGKESRVAMSGGIGSALPEGERATVEIKNGAQFFDNASASLVRTNNWVLSGRGYSPTSGGEGMGVLRIAPGVTYSGDIAILPGGASIGGSDGSTAARFTGNISGDKLLLGTLGWNDGWFIKAELTGDNSGLESLDVLRANVTASSATALGKNINLTVGTENNTSRVNIAADVIVETFKGVAGTTLDIMEGKSLTFTGTGTSTFFGKLSGKGGIKLQGGSSWVLNGDSSAYGGAVVAEENSSLIMGGGASAAVSGLSGAGNLVLREGASLTVNGLSGGDLSLGGVVFSGGSTLTLQTAATASQTFGAVSLRYGVNSLVVDANAGGLTLNVDNITGPGMLIVSGLESFTGTLGQGVSPSGILFQKGDGLYEAVSADGVISAGAVKLSELQASGNEAGKTYSLSGNLTMTNAAGENVGRILARGFTDDSTTLTLGAGGLSVAGAFMFDGGGKNLTVTGSRLSADVISASGGGTLTIDSELVIDGKRTTTLSNASGTTLTLSNVALNDGTLNFSGTAGVTSLKVAAAGGTLNWIDGSTSDVSGGISFTASGTTLVLNPGNGGLVFNSAVAGTGSTLNLASGKMAMVQGQTQDFKVDAGTELTFNITENKSTASGKFSGKGTVVFLNKTNDARSLDNDQSSDWADFGGRLILDGNGKGMRKQMNDVLGTALPVGEKAVVEVKNGAQYFDNGDNNSAVTRTCDWIISGTGSDDFGTLRATNAEYSGNITILSGGASIAGAVGGAVAKFTGNISGDTLSLGTKASNTNGYQIIATELSGDNSGLKGIVVLRGPVTANSSTALGRNLNLTLAKPENSTSLNYSIVNINAAVTLETLKGVTGALIDIKENKSLALTGSGKSSYAGDFAGKGSLLLQDSVKVTLNGNSSAYEGSIVVGNDASLIIGGGTTAVNSLTGTGNLYLQGAGTLALKGLTGNDHSLGDINVSGGGTLKIQTGAGGASQTFEGMSLLGGVSSLVVEAGAGALTLNMGVITGSGMLIVSGLDSFTGTFGAGASLGGILFQKADGLYDAVSSNGTISAGADRIGELQATGNVADKSYTLSQSLTMTNAAGESVRRVLAQGFTADSTLTLGAGGLTVTDSFAFTGGGKTLIITGSKLSAGEISATGGGTLKVDSELVVDGKRATDVSTASGTALTLANVTLNDGTLSLSGAVGVTALNVGAAGGTISWLNGSTTDISEGLTLTAANSTLVLNAGTGLVFGKVIKSATEGDVSTVELASGRLQLEQKQVQNFKVDAGAELTFNITSNERTATGSFTGNGTVVILNKTQSTWDMPELGSDWSNFNGHLILDGGGKNMRQQMNTIIGAALPAGPKAVVEIKNGAQYFDNGDNNASLVRICDWVISGTGSDGFGALRVAASEYTGNITVLAGGANIGGATGGGVTKITGNISGDTLSLGTIPGDNSWRITTELSGDNSGLKGINVLRGPVTANSATALGKNLNLTIAKSEGATAENYSVVRINAAVALETLNGIAGTLLEINDAKSLTLTGTETSTYTGILKGSGALNLNGSGLVTLDGDYSGFSGAISVGKDASLTLSGTMSGAKGAITVGEGGNLLALSKEALGTPTSIAVNGGKFRYEGADFVSMPVSLTNGGILSFSQSQTVSKKISGSGKIEMDGGTTLSIQGLVLDGMGLTLGGNNAVAFTSTTAGIMNLGTLSVTGTGNSIDYASGVNLALKWSGLLMDEGDSLDITNYDYSKNNYISIAGETAWAKLDGVTLNGEAAMVDTLGRLTVYQEDVMVGSLVSKGVTASGQGYKYEGNNLYYGALAGFDVDFSQPFQFGTTEFTYGFTTQDDRNTGMTAGSFTVSGLMTDGSNVRVVSVIGQAGAADRTVTLTNTGNSFTGDVTVTNAVLKADAARPELIGSTPVTILGKGNTVYLKENATLNLATGNGSYVYANNFVLSGSNSLLTQTEGQHTLTGTVTVLGTDNANRTIENTLKEGTLTLAGALIANGANTLTLKTNEDSIIALSLNGNATLSGLNVAGHVRQTKNTVTVTGGMTLGTNGSYDLAGGVLAVAGSLSSDGALERVVTLGNGTTLAAVGSQLEVKRGVTLAFSQEQTSFALDTGAGTISFQGNLAPATAGNTLVKRGAGVLELATSLSTKAMIKVEQGTLFLKEGISLNAEGDFTVQSGSVLDMGKGSSLSLSSAKTLTFNGSLTGQGNISGVDKLTFGNGTRYAANMNGQTWNANFKTGSTFSGSLLKHTGNIVFDSGSHIMFDTTLPVSDDSIAITTSGGGTVRFNGATVGGTTSSPEIDWDSTLSYVFTLVESVKELLGADGQALTMDNLNQSIAVGGNGWGAFLQGELAVSEDSKELQVTVTRNGNALSSYAQTSNQAVVGRALDEAMNNFSTLGLRGTELGDIIQYFNKMGQNIAAEAPEALGMVGGLSNYQALAGQRTDMMRHMEAVRQRANAGKGLVGISNIPDNSFWAEGTQGYSRIDGTDSSTPGYTAQSWGAAIGMDYLSAPTYSLGVAFAYSNLKVDSNQYAGQTKSDNYYVDLYGRWESGNWNGVVVLSGGTANVDVKRTMSLGADTYNGTGSTDGTQILGMAEVAYNWQWEEEGPVLQPYLGMAVGQSKLDGYTESGLGNASLMLDEQKQTVAQASLGVRLFKQNIDREMQYEESRWELRAGLVEEFGDTDFVTRSSFIGLPGYTMQTRSEDIGKTGLQIGAGFSKALDESWSVFGDVNGEFRSGQKSINSTLGLRCTF